MALSAIFILMTGPALASGKIYYGSRAGMTVTVVSLSGIDTSNAVIRTRHTRDDAIGFCRDYVQKVTPQCIREQLAIPLNDQISANCLTGEFVDFGGRKFRFEGRLKKKREDLMAAFVVRNLTTGEIADGSSASGYPTNIGIFRALCPNHAPSPHEE